MSRSYCLLPIIIYLFFMSGCSSEATKDPAIDYSELPLINTEKEFSISASDDFIPALITRIMVAENGDILVSQRSDRTITQFDSLGNYIARVAGPGRGPGELSEYPNPHFNGQILVMSNNHGMLTEYQPNKEGIFEYTTDYTFRLPGPMRGIRSEKDFSSFYVQVDSARTPFGTIPPEFTTDLVHLVKVVADTLQVKESILSLRKHSAFIEISDNGNRMSYEYLPYRYNDYFTPLENQKILVARTGESLIQIYDKNLQVEHEVKLDVKDRFITEADMEYHFPELSRTERRDRRKLIKDIKPPFTGVILDDQDRFWIWTDETQEGKEMVILNYEGTPLGRMLLPSESSLQAISNGKLYTVNRESETTIEAYSVSFSN
ncbi:hypothetical protein [Gracilimonas tropica]|uniref:hypothetical protein n=1 Tax=Gracilimonas tropica TaxID=454600 RepID=UPI00035C1D56|nr:hypothetical protein [Gracilimonas tropica]